MNAARPHRAYERWTADEDKALLAARAERRTHAEIGATLGRSADSVAWRSRELHAASRQHPWTPAEVAAAVRLRRLERRWSEIRDALAAKGFPRRGISQIVRKIRPLLPLDPPCLRRWTLPELRTALSLRAEGKTWREVREGLWRAGYERRTVAALQRRLLHLKMES